MLIQAYNLLSHNFPDPGKKGSSSFAFFLCFFKIEIIALRRRRRQGSKQRVMLRVAWTEKRVQYISTMLMLYGVGLSMSCVAVV
jgi:hypothetical protein